MTCEWVDYGPDMDGTPGIFECGRHANPVTVTSDEGEPMVVWLCDKHARQAVSRP